MPRRSRFVLAGIPWRIIQRENNRAACFSTDEDRHYDLNILQDQSEKNDCDMHAYVLTTNEIYLLPTAKQKNSAS